MLVICDDCPLLSPFLYCQLRYKVSRDPDRMVERGTLVESGTYSDDCRLIKIITKDGEILPEEVKE